MAKVFAKEDFIGRVKHLARLRKEIEEKIEELNRLNQGYYNASCRDFGFPMANQEVHSNKLVLEQPVTRYSLGVESDAAVTVAKKKNGEWSKKSDGRGITWDCPWWYKYGNLLSYSTYQKLKDNQVPTDSEIYGRNNWLEVERQKGDSQ